MTVYGTFILRRQAIHASRWSRTLGALIGGAVQARVCSGFRRTTTSSGASGCRGGRRRLW